MRRIPAIVIPDERHRADEGEFSSEQFASLITQLEAKERSAPLVPLVKFLYRTGMRAQEPMGMKVGGSSPGSPNFAIAGTPD